MHRQLFLDDLNVQRANGVKRQAQPAKRYAGNPVMTPLHPWERTRTQLYGRAVIYNPLRCRYQMFYIAMPSPHWYERIRVGDRELPAHATLPCLAESEDGTHWERPVLGQCSFNDVADTNLLKFTRGMSFEGGAIYDPFDPDPQRRFKMFFWDQKAQLLPEGKLEYEGWGWSGIVRVRDEAGRILAEEPYNDWGMEVAFSPDGVRWTRHPGPVLRCYSDTGNSVVYDAQLKRYVGFGRFNLTKLAAGGEFIMGRGVARVESDDFVHWSEPEMVLTADADDPVEFQINSMPIDIYEGVYIGLIEDFGIKSMPDYVPAMQLATSRDGRHWTRVADRAAMIEPAKAGDWDANSPTGGSVRPSTGLFVAGDEVRFYYCASTPGKPLCIGMASWRRDGFVRMHARDTGEILTRPFTVDGANLHLNVDARDGEVTVQVCDVQGRNNEAWGCSEESQPIHCDSTDTVVRWAKDNLSELRGQVVTLRIRLKHASLYAYWM